MVTVIDNEANAVEWLNKNYKSICFYAIKEIDYISSKTPEISLFNADREELACVALDFAGYRKFKELLNEKLTVTQFVKLVKKKDLKFDNMVFSVRKPSGCSYIWPGCFTLNSKFFTKLNNSILKKFPDIMDVPHIKNEVARAIKAGKKTQEKLEADMNACKLKYSQLKSNIAYVIKENNKIAKIASVDMRSIYGLKK